MGEEEDLPVGVEPWDGEEMPEGVVSVVPEPDHAEALTLYQLKFAGEPIDTRVHAAQSSRGADLLALCFDQEPRVAAALLDNSEFGPSHARMIARHHHNGRGLEILSRRRSLLADAEVQRRLLQNPQLASDVLARLVTLKALRDVYKLSIDRDLPERNRVSIRNELRRKYSQAEPEERADLVLRTEGRALLFLVGCTFDGRMTQILCAKSIVSTLLIGNLARFSATPPALLAKLIQNPVVKRQPQLRQLLLKHPNLPSDLKR
ncbi:MAG: hypothetical protein SFV15_08330 [Polyangiaceae bacterium]|nr:hypothetical protein [Polyangiaceae bacterium]